MARPADPGFAKWFATHFEQQNFFDLPREKLREMNSGFLQQAGEFVSLPDNPTEAEVLQHLQAQTRRPIPIYPHLIEQPTSENWISFGMFGKHEKPGEKPEALKPATQQPPKDAGPEKGPRRPGK